MDAAPTDLRLPRGARIRLSREVRRTFDAGRSAAVGPEHALNNAKDVIQIERWLGSFHEETIQEWFLDWRWFIQFWNAFYGIAHFVVTLAVFALLALLDSYPVQHESLQAAFDDDGNPSGQVAINPIMNLLDVLRREGLSTLKEHHYEAIMDTFKNNTRLMKTFSPQRFEASVRITHPVARQLINWLDIRWFNKQP